MKELRNRANTKDAKKWAKLKAIKADYNLGY